MESDTKNKQTKENIILMLEKALGKKISFEEVSVKELTEGFCNAAYEVVSPEGEMILKIAPPGKAGLMTYEDNMMRAEVDSLRLVKANTSLPVPEVYYYDDSHNICTSDYFFMEKLPGESFSKLRFEGGMPEDEVNQILYQIGRCNVEMNRITGDRYGYLGVRENQGTSWRDTFLSMAANVLADGEKIDMNLGISYDEVRDLIDKASFALDEVKIPQFLHGDLWEGNVFVKDGKITGFIDFERALWGDPVMEYFVRLHCHNQSFDEGYGKKLRKEAPIRALLYDMYLYLIMVIETKYRNYPDDWQYGFATKNLGDTVEQLKRLI
ncbi:MAG: aminoglycoside phosphotransferase [Herbinix sp.]|nr:aminoglycoside phosphotransferase [Herbinix sp.]